MPPTRRPRTSAFLVAGAFVLLGSILIGQKLGDRVLLQTEQRVPIAGSGVTPVPEAQPSDAGDLKNWKRLQVVSVATDPAFPDPRVTVPPRPRPTPSPTPTPTPKPKARPTEAPPAIYTSPPLPVPIVSHSPDDYETPAPSEAPLPP
ncbi:MAG TPA: hypothetical protein VFB22_16695 [Candidatus Baltobacteraceae bacterium]|nr:hypothetical protein [Candidatus Baltobacteraceae bacterium]